MKKITLLTVLFILPFLGTAQGPWDFTNTDDGWVKGGGCTAATGATAWTLTTNGGNNPNFTNTATAIDADVNVYAAVTLKLSAGAPTLMRLRIPKATTGFVYKSIVLDPSQTGFVTYYINATDTEWGGTENDVRFQFKDDNGSAGGINHGTTGETIEIDKVEFISSVPATVQNTFNFDASEEGWDETIRCSVTAGSGTLDVQLAGIGTVGDTNNSKVTLNPLFAVNATGNPSFHITVKNNSNDDQIKIVYPNTIDGGFVTVTQVVSTNDTEFKTYDLDLGSNANWTGEINSLQLVFDDAGAQEGTGIFQIDNITIDNTAVLSTPENSLNNFSVYPNPAQSVVNIKGYTTLSKVELFDITGKKVLETSQLVNDQLNIESVNTGIYLLRIVDTRNNVTVKRLIIE